MARNTWLKQSSVRNMTPVEAAWVGAMIEAEGSVGAHPRYSGKGVRVSVSNTDPEVISALLRAVGTGGVHCQDNTGPKAVTSIKPCYVWQVQARLEVQAIARQCAPYSMKLQGIGV